MKDNNKKIKLTFVGDIMSKIQQNEASVDQTGKYNYKKIFENVEGYLKESDFLIGNLETPIAGKKMEYSYVPFSFNTPEEFIVAVKEAGFDLVTTANNHCLDRGIEGLKLTIDNLDKIGLDHIGTYKSQKARDNIYIKEINNIKFAFISYTYGTNAHVNNVYIDEKNRYYVNLLKAQEKPKKKNSIIKRIYMKIKRILKLDTYEPFSYNKEKKYLKQFVEEIKKAKEQADYVIFCMHSGGQYNEKQDNYTKKLCRFAIKKGVDFVVGCHPHVVHGSKKMRDNKYIAYSLGNFCSTPYTNSKQKDDLPDYSIVLNLYFDKKSKKVESITFNVVKSILDENGYSYLEFIDEYIEKIEYSELKEKVKQDSIKIVNKFYNLNTSEIKREYKVL